MNIQYLSKRLAFNIARVGLQLGLCWILAITAKAMPHWAVSTPGGNGASILDPMVAKSGVLYLHYLTSQGTVHMSKWASGVGYSDLGELGGALTVHAMYTQGNYLYVAGFFTMLCPSGTATNVAKYDISNNQWSPVGDGTFTQEVWAVSRLTQMGGFTSARVMAATTEQAWPPTCSSIGAERLG